MESLAGKTSEEAAATDITDPLGVLAGWQPDDGSYDWECLDAILKWTFYTSVPISILRPIWKLDTAHEIFNYLAKRFRNSNPIVDPRATSANDAKHDVHENSHTELRESPVSDNTAAEWHADAKRDEEDLPNTKDLPNRGMEHVDEENVRRKDLHTSTEASVTGTSAECADGTLVLLEGAPHKTRNEPQNSLRATPRRLPIEGEPCECEQEVANGVVTAGHMNGTAGTAKPIIADVDRTATLGKDLATVACGVDKGNETECNKLRLQQTNLFCEKANQHNRNAEEDIPSAQRLLLEGEWTGYASGEASDPKGNENTLNAAIEHVDGSREQCRLTDIDGVMSEGCNGGTSKCVNIDEADDDPG
ncbi:hypothetical protein SCLCIDRAFT_21845 [Scleroderma citrinum Foug A]|uniref:Uncharacterized protein n=1 Tax=Scleroderma citrinum Foug A TaxID=1036808 RepID=A0A0C3ANZ4_9AGAM|nr:hypothetical protein SCLCIDRAFT_21845 [Scleroderma citrinum Foug A]